MNRARTIMLVIAVVLGGAWLGWRAWGPRPSEDVLSGYVEGENLYLAAPIAGTVTAMQVTRGERVAAGAPLFTMDAASLRAQRDQAAATLAHRACPARAIAGIGCRGRRAGNQRRPGPAALSQRVARQC